jgi:hypothetical protein
MICTFHLVLLGWLNQNGWGGMIYYTYRRKHINTKCYLRASIEVTTSDIWMYVGGWYWNESLRKHVKIETGLHWLGMMYVGRHFWWWLCVGFIKMMGILHQIINYKVSKGRLCCVEHISYLVFILVDTVAPLKVELLVINIILVTQYVPHKKHLTSPLQRSPS